MGRKWKRVRNVLQKWEQRVQIEICENNRPFPTITESAALSCAGNEWRAYLTLPKGEQWQRMKTNSLILSTP